MTKLHFSSEQAEDGVKLHVTGEGKDYELLELLVQGTMQTLRHLDISVLEYVAELAEADSATVVMEEESVMDFSILYQLASGWEE